MDLQTLMQDFFQTDNLKLLMVDTSALFGCPVMIVDDAFHPVSWHRTADFRDPLFQMSIDRGELSYEISTMLINSKRMARKGEVYMALTGSPHRRRLSPLVAGGIRVGYLIMVDVRGTLRSADRSVLSQVESVLAKQLFFENNRSRVALSTEEEVLLHLLEGKFASEPLFRAQAAAVGLGGFHPHRFALVNLELYHSADLSENALRGALTASFPDSRPLLYNGDVLLFLGESPDFAELNRLAEQFRLRAVVSAPLDSLYALPRGYAAAREILEYLLPGATKPFVAAAERYHTLMLLRRAAGQPELADSRVRALAERDAAEGSLYCRTLYTYLACHHSLQETCARLYTHRNTVLYRVRRMKEDFGIPLDDPDQHLPLLLAAALALLAAGEDALFVPAEAAPDAT